MKSFKRIFMIGVLALASMGLFIGQNEARAANTTSDRIRTYRCVSTESQALNHPAGHVLSTIYDMDSPIDEAHALGIMDYNYVDTSSNGQIPVTVTMNSGESYTFIAGTQHCVVSFVPFSPVIQQLWSDWYEREGNPKKVCRCMNLYKELAGTTDVTVATPQGTAYVPPLIADGILQTGSSDAIDQLFPLPPQ